MKKLLDTVGASPLVGAAPKTMENWRTSGFGPKFIKAGRRVFYDPEDIEEWKAAHRFASTSEAA